MVAVEGDVAHELGAKSDVAHPPKRKDVQGLRAVAVCMVIVYHYFPAAVRGGFVGVDVFFVISGFLITGLLVRELERTRSISLSTFYSRRVRRLMPTAFATTATTVVAAFFIVAPVRFVSVLRDATWTGAYLANVQFARVKGGYFAAANPSPLLHLWSLAVEEQYYLIWPLLLLGVALVTKKRALSFLPGILAVVFAGSLLASIVLTGSNANFAYYSLATRAWELAIGGIVALLVFRNHLLRRSNLAVPLSVIGMLVTLAGAFAYSRNTAFPGMAALLPTAGTAFVIWAGTYHHGLVSRGLSVRPAQMIGDMSYSLYLWHWPVLILGVEVMGGSLAARAFLLGLTALLSGAS